MTALTLVVTRDTFIYLIIKKAKYIYTEQPLFRRYQSVIYASTSEIPSRLLNTGYQIIRRQKLRRHCRSLLIFCAKNSALWSDRYGCILIHCSYFEIEDSNRLCFIHLINIFCTASLSLSEGHNTMQALLRKIRQILRDRRTRRFL